MSYLIGINVRTRGVDCVLIDQNGKMVRTVTEPYQLAAGSGECVEQDPGDWWKATTTALGSLTRELDPDSVTAIGVSGEMAGLVALDKDNNVVRNAILWTDSSSLAEYNKIIAEAGVDALADSKSVDSRLVESELYWIKKHEPDAYKRIAKFVMPKDYICYMLTGVASASDLDAKKSVFFNTEDQEWDNEIISKVGFDIVVFPPVADSNAPCGAVTEGASLDTGLPFNIPVYSASLETVMENASMSVVHEDAAALLLGPSAVVSVASREIPNVGDGRLWTASIDDGASYMVYGHQACCGDAFEWAQNALVAEQTDPAAAFLELTGNAPAGSNGVVFLPHLMGGSQKRKNGSDASGVFFGMTILTSRADLARSVVEGVVLGMYEIYEFIRHENHKLAPKEIIVSGSASASSVLKQVVADVFNLPVKVYQGALEGGAYGAALVAGVGEGLFKSFAEAEKLHHIAEEYQPDNEKHTLYMHNLELFRILEKDLKKSFETASEP